MNEEEYFRKNYPDSCYGDKPLSPHWDFFQDGVEFGERESEKRIAELEKENAELQHKVDILQGFLDRDVEFDNLQKENAELKLKLKALEGQTPWKDIKDKSEVIGQLTKAKEIILRLYNAGRDVLMCRTEEKAYDNLSNAVNDKSIEQFLKECK